VPIAGTNLQLDARQYKRKDPMDSQIISNMSLPGPLHATYSSCDAPPALNEFNPMRPDGKISLKFYSDPDYFFRLWYVLPRYKPRCGCTHAPTSKVHIQGMHLHMFTCASTHTS